MSQTKIVVLQVKKLIRVGIAIGIGILVIIIIAFMLSGKDGDSENKISDTAAEGKYESGQFTKEIQMGDAYVNVQLSLEGDHIKGLELVNLEKSVKTMYPLMEPTVEKISKQLVSGKDVAEIEISEESQYTEKVILGAVEQLLEEHKK